ncbi:MAG: glycosyltransferase [Candidatus Rokubacteria bacterium]|nr:glycosyltransferase [Candidatus Rokubacteria bacterium]MBI3825281.1 glycosyltransferase [Candidatus Rokubacteria bacterium]
MKVAVVSHAYVTAVNHDKLEALARLADVAVTLLVPSSWPAAFGVLRPPARGDGYRIVAAPVVFAGHIGGFVFRGGLRALAGQDVVHAELEPWSLGALQCLLVAPATPLVVFTWENLERPLRRLARVVERIVLRRAAFVIAGNAGARERMRRRGVPDRRLAVLPQFGVDPARYTAGDAGRVAAPFPVASPRPRPVVGYVGRLVPEKGVDVLIDAMSPGLGRLLVVGDGPTRGALEARAAARGLEAAFTGAVADTAVPDHLAAMDVLVLPSRTIPGWAEQFGHALIEAMAAGVPVIGSSSGAIPEVIGDAGLVFPEGDARALAGGLARVLGDEPLRKDLAGRGVARVAARFTHAVVAEAQRGIYARLRRR